MKGLIFLLVLSFICIGSIICTAWRPPATSQEMPAFAGSEACKSCHRDIFNDTRHTAHYLSSALPHDAHIKGSFAPGKNEFVYNQWMDDNSYNAVASATTVTPDLVRAHRVGIYP